MLIPRVCEPLNMSYLETGFSLQLRFPHTFSFNLGHRVVFICVNQVVILSSCIQDYTPINVAST